MLRQSQNNDGKVYAGVHFMPSLSPASDNTGDLFQKNSSLRKDTPINDLDIFAKPTEDILTRYVEGLILLPNLMAAANFNTSYHRVQKFENGKHAPAKEDPTNKDPYKTANRTYGAKFLCGHEHNLGCVLCEAYKEQWETKDADGKPALPSAVGKRQQIVSLPFLPFIKDATGALVNSKDGVRVLKDIMWLDIPIARLYDGALKHRDKAPFRNVVSCQQWLEDAGDDTSLAVKIEVTPSVKGGNSAVYFFSKSDKNLLQYDAQLERLLLKHPLFQAGLLDINPDGTINYGDESEYLQFMLAVRNLQYDSPLGEDLLPVSQLEDTYKHATELVLSYKDTAGISYFGRECKNYYA